MEPSWSRQSPWSQGGVGKLMEQAGVSKFMESSWRRQVDGAKLECTFMESIWSMQVMESSWSWKVNGVKLD
jgi:hypothetical protein